MTQLWFNVPICSACWDRVHPERVPHRYIGETVDCVICGHEVSRAAPARYSTTATGADTWATLTSSSTPVPVLCTTPCSSTAVTHESL